MAGTRASSATAASGGRPSTPRAARARSRGPERATAMNAIIDTSETISKIRGQFIDFSPQFLENKTKIFTIFHPSFLMRQSAKKRLTWLDMLNLQKFIKNNYEE